MKKKKKVYLFRTIKLIIFWVFVLSGTFLIIDNYLNKKTDFKFLKEECVNKTEYGWNLITHPINLTVNKSELVFLNRELLLYRFLEKVKIEQKDILSNYRYCRIREDNDFVIIKETPELVVYTPKNYLWNRGLYLENCEKIVQKCEKIEVEEIDMNSYNCLQNKTNSDECGFVEFYEGLIISRKNLTKEFLENTENCECIGGNYWIENRFYDKVPTNCLECKMKNLYKNFKCLVNITNKECVEFMNFYSYNLDCWEYKCFKNYFVEVELR